MILTSPGEVKIGVRYGINGHNNDIDTTDIRTFTAISARLIGPGEICTNTAFEYAALTTSPHVEDYTWSFPSGITLSGNSSPFNAGYNINLAVGSSAVSGNICITVNGTGCTTGPSACIYGRVSSRVPNAPGVITASVDGLACPGFGWLLSVAPVNDATFYNWSCTNTGYFVLDNLVGSYSNNLNVTGQGYSQTTMVSVNAANGCGMSADRSKNLTSWSRDDCGGARLRSPENDEKFKNRVFYNASLEVLTINFQENELHNIYVYNLLGEVIFFQTQISDHNLEIDAHSLINGYYLVKIESGLDVQSVKFLVAN